MKSKLYLFVVELYDNFSGIKPDDKRIYFVKVAALLLSQIGFNNYKGGSFNCYNQEKSYNVMASYISKVNFALLEYTLDSIVLHRPIIKVSNIPLQLLNQFVILKVYWHFDRHAVIMMNSERVSRF